VSMQVPCLCFSMCMVSECTQSCEVGGRIDESIGVGSDVTVREQGCYSFGTHELQHHASASQTALGAESTSFGFGGGLSW
jgi:hypothetical protein